MSLNQAAVQRYREVVALHNKQQGWFPSKRPVQCVADPRCSDWNTIADFLLLKPRTFYTQSAWMKKQLSFDTIINQVLSTELMMLEEKNSLVVSHPMLSADNDFSTHDDADLLACVRDWVFEFLASEVSSSNFTSGFRWIVKLFQEKQAVYTLDLRQINFSSGDAHLQGLLQDFLAWVVIYPELQSILLHPEDGALSPTITAVLHEHQLLHNALLLAGKISFLAEGFFSLQHDYHYWIELLPYLHDIVQQSELAMDQLLNQLPNIAKETTEWTRLRQPITGYFARLLKKINRITNAEIQHLINTYQRPDLMSSDLAVIDAIRRFEIAECAMQAYKQTLQSGINASTHAQPPPLQDAVIGVFNKWLNQQPQNVSIMFASKFRVFTYQRGDENVTPVVLLTNTSFRYIPDPMRPEQHALQQLTDLDYWENYFELTVEEKKQLIKGNLVEKGYLSAEQRQQLVAITGYVPLAAHWIFLPHPDCFTRKMPKSHCYAQEWYHDLFLENINHQESAYRWVFSLMSDVCFYQLDLSAIALDVTVLPEGAKKMDRLLKTFVRCYPMLVHVALSPCMPAFSASVQQQLHNNQYHFSILFIDPVKHILNVDHYAEMQKTWHHHLTRTFYEACKGLDYLLSAAMKKNATITKSMENFNLEDLKTWFVTLQERASAWNREENYDADAHQEWLDLAKGVNGYFERLENEWMSINQGSKDKHAASAIAVSDNPLRMIERRETIRRQETSPVEKLPINHKHWSTHHSIVSEERRRALVANRHHSPEEQKAYDEQFGVNTFTIYKKNF